MNQINLCASCDHCALDDKRIWYCASKASRDVDPNCLPLTKMYEYQLCGPAVQWKHWEKKK